jgi:hypothetical protein
MLNLEGGGAEKVSVEVLGKERDWGREVQRPQRKQSGRR